MEHLKLIGSRITGRECKPYPGHLASSLTEVIVINSPLATGTRSQLLYKRGFINHTLHLHLRNYRPILSVLLLLHSHIYYTRTVRVRVR